MLPDIQAALKDKIPSVKLNTILFIKNSMFNQKFNKKVYQEINRQIGKELKQMTEDANSEIRDSALHAIGILAAELPNHSDIKATI